MYFVSQEDFLDRRRKVMDAIGEDSVLILVAPPPRTRSHDTNYRYRPSSDVLYLTGYREMEAVIVLAPGHETGEFVMFVSKRDPLAEMWEGRRLGPEGAVEKYGADAAFNVDEIDAELPKLLKGRERLFYTLGSDLEFDQRMIGWVNKLRHQRQAPSAAPGAIVDPRDVLHGLRIVKRPEELELMRKASTINAQAHQLAMEYCQPGMHEYELQALIEYHFTRSGAEYPAYASIVGGGDNATILHYTENRDVLRGSDVVLIDAGCELEFYASDITRSFPVSGTFTPAQRDVYQAVLEVQIAAIEDVRPGVAYDELPTRTVRRLTQSLIDLGLLQGSVDELIEGRDYKKYYPHSVGHWLGIDVHDRGSYHDDLGGWRELVPGMVLTIEPGIYIPASDESAPEELRGIGVRIEDDIVVTENGYENMTWSCPKSVTEIEALVGTKTLPF